MRGRRRENGQDHGTVDHRSQDRAAQIRDAGKQESHEAIAEEAGEGEGDGSEEFGGFAHGDSFLWRSDQGVRRNTSL